MLTEVILTNFKGHTSTRVPLGQFTVLVGPNGSGKTSVLQAIQCMASVVSGKPLDSIVLPIRAEQTKAQLEISGAFLERKYTLEFKDLSRLSGGSSNAKASWTLDGKEAQTIPPEGFTYLSLQGLAHWSSHLRSADRIFKINPSVVAASASSSQPRPKVEFDGRNVAVALKAMKLGFDENWEKFREISRRIIPSLVNVVVEQVEAQTVQQCPSPSQDTAPPPSGEWYRLFFDFKDARRISSLHASEGTLLTVALLTVLLGPSRPSLILLDDIEQTLHPAAQLELVRQLTALLGLDEMKGVQVIATTHSPFILDELRFDQVQVFAQRDDGSVTTRGLDQHPDARRLQGGVSAGELWTSDPESSWVTAP